MLLLAAVLAPGCRRAAAPASQATPAVTGRVALVAGAETAPWWLEKAQKGLARVAEEIHAEPTDLGVVAPEAYRDAVDGLGRSGVDLVFCLGAGWAQVVYTESVAYPDTRFVVVGAESPGETTTGVTFGGEEATYLGGVLAATLGSSQRIGILTGGGGAWLDRLEEGYVAGFHSLDRKAEVVRFAGTEGVGALVQAGAKVAFYSAEQADPEVLAAARAGGLDLVLVDPQPLAKGEEPVVAAVEIDLPEAMLRVAREADSEGFRGRTYTFDLGSGVIDLEVSPRLRANEGASLIDAMAQARAEITAGIAEIEKLGF